MLERRPSAERGHANHGWLDSFHSFSFAGYHDPAHMGFGPLRVINEDRIGPGQGFGTHGHRDMEILSYVLEGELAHRDSMGHVEVIRPGEMQRMSAGTGVQHSEFNPQADRPTHFLQIWIEPDVRGLVPGYESRTLVADEADGRLALVASGDPADEVVRVHQDVRLHVGRFDGPQHAGLQVDPARWVYVHLARGRLTVNGEALAAGDALKVTDTAKLAFGEGREAEVLVFDLPAGR